MIPCNQDGDRPRTRSLEKQLLIPREGGIQLLHRHLVDKGVEWCWTVEWQKRMNGAEVLTFVRKVVGCEEEMVYCRC